MNQLITAISGLINLFLAYWQERQIRKKIEDEHYVYKDDIQPVIESIRNDDNLDADFLRNPKDRRKP